MRVLVDQAAAVVGDIDGNTRRFLGTIEAAARAGARIALGPELGISGYPPRDLLGRRAFIDACREAAHRIGRATAGTGVIAVFGVPWREGPSGDGPLRNSAVVARNGAIIAVRHKSLLPAYDVFDEPRHFLAETDPRPVVVDGLRLGITICEDLWNVPGFSPDPRYTLDPVARMGPCDLHLNLSASPFHVGKQAERIALLRAQVRRAGAPIVYCNQVGANDHLLFDGGSIAVDVDGMVLVQAAPFEETRLLVDTDARPVAPTPLGPEEELHRALSMGIRDYAARCGIREATLGLSGGIDSAVVAALAVEALGPERVRGVGLPGPFSSPGSLTDAEALARNLGIRFDVVPITESWEGLQRALGGVFEGRPAGLAEENLQARLRGTVLMAISNKLGPMLLTTGNKSEMAVGYCTLYGDMCGALAVIGDVYKTDVYRLARWINREREIIPVATIEKPPSAELAPNQTDQDSLPPYDLLDAVLARYVDDGQDPAEIVAAGFDAALVARVTALVRGSEYKRWQAAPVLRVSRRAFGYGRRIPLAAKSAWDRAND